MKRKVKINLLAAGVMAACSATSVAQAPRESPVIASSDVLSQISMFSYRDGPKSELYFRGTPIAALADGSAEIEYQDGNAEISARVDGLPEASSLGPYTVYVLWALTPDGRAANQGTFSGSDSNREKIETTYGASQFALIVTAEPHFAVTVPSSMIALYNVADDVKGSESRITTLIERSDYSNLTPVPVSEENPVELVQARYALAIADAVNAEQFAAPDYQQASQKLTAAEAAIGAERRSERKLAPQLGREAVIAGEDARRAAMIGSAAADRESERVAAAGAATAVANAAAEADREATSLRTEAEREATSLRTEAEREAAAARAAQSARTDLRNRFNAALPTRDSARGLISEVGGVQFATGQAEVNATARESVARFAGIAASYPDLRLSVEGHTDSVGSNAANDALSLRRANAVRDLLIAQGLDASSIGIAGFGSARPSGDNATSEGRARNRRVEIVVSGGPLALNATEPLTSASTTSE